MKTYFEDSVINDAYSWYATTDEYKLHWDNLDELKSDVLYDKNILKNILQEYWSIYVGNPQEQ